LLIQSLDRAHDALDFDIAIYGAGPAGITLALALSRQGTRVGLFEAGGTQAPELNTEHPYAGQSVGRPYDLLNTRLRYLGGTSNHWGGWVRPLDPYDFQKREFQPLSGWPFGLEELRAYYGRAMQMCEVSSGGLGLQAFDHDFGDGDFIHNRSDWLLSKNFLFSPPTRFGQRYRDDIENDEKLRCFTGATLTHLGSDGTHVQEAEVTDSGFKPHVVRARVHVLAMGAVENARLLLHSSVANSSGFVGRCFADHLGTKIAQGIVNSASRYYRHEVEGGDGEKFNVLPHLAFPEDVMREQELVNFGIIFMFSQRTDNQLERGIRRNVYSQSASGADRVAIVVRMENTPNPESRLVLSNRLDPYGLPRLVVDWKINQSDFLSLERAAKALLPQFGLGGGRMRLDLRHLRDQAPNASLQAHQLGTTRMSEDPAMGVVNSELRSHDLRNLYVVGSSVFPTYGFANPTLTIVALTLKLADHLTEITA
jgi:choline dehydrogenase-like flavoprotein